ncbi:porin family protein [Vibrio brasiliensis]|uniref:outer membrane beta-barrel protein n=1 Tax=Vibrio brasiliensis TaxID=170652 RepID=UPI001EFCDE89|nr:outer membrane beta-barrel protein [Vibrio brasiliensis]MCG9648785.1 porin family protein [Vibrio brasiliensis]
MKKVLLASLVIACSTPVLANVDIGPDTAGYRLGFTTNKGELELSGGGLPTYKQTATLEGVELGYDFNKIVGVTASFSKGDESTSTFRDSRFTAELGYTFLIGDSTDFTIKPYGSLGYEKGTIEDGSQNQALASDSVSISGFTAGVGVRATIFKYGYIGIEESAIAGDVAGVDCTVTNTRIGVGAKWDF